MVRDRLHGFAAGMLRAVSGLLLAAALALPGPVFAQGGALKGGVAYELPSWLKASFLDFKGDIEEARKQGRHVMVFLHLDECPYCARMLQESFSGGDNTAFMQRHFDVVAVNIRGDLEARWIDGKSYSERDLARHLKVYATPAVVFLDAQSGKVLQLDGYRDPKALRHALEYVQGRHYRDQAFAAYLASRSGPAVYALRAHPLFSDARRFKGYRKPLAVLFEDRQCAECARFHDKTLSHPEVVAEMKKFLFVRLDTGSAEPVVDLAGRTRTAADWAKELGVSYRPGMVLFNEGRAHFRMDGLLYHFHFKEALRYVSGEHYKRHGSVSKYNAARRQELLGQGIDIDYAESR